MILGFMRHARRSSALDERDPGISTEGIKEARRAAGMLPFHPHIIFSSPLRRALETAKVVAEALGGVEVSVSDKLEPGIFSMDALKELGPPNHSLLIGHNPSIERVVSALLGCSIRLHYSSIAVLDVPVYARGSSTLIALILPRPDAV